MSIQINEIGPYVVDFILYYFSILLKVIPICKSYTDIPKVVIQVGEFIVGSIDISDSDGKYISEFYEVFFSHDSDILQFDWQNGLVGLYINVGDIRLTTKNPDFVLYPPGVDSILTLTKEEILLKGK